MAERIQAWLYWALGRRWYLYLVSQLFFLAYRTGLLRGTPEYACHYYVRRWIEPGDCVVDIGANLGYYSVLFAEWTGTAGTVYSVEPVPLYREVLRWNVRSFPQVEILPYALDTEPGTVQMGVPDTVAPHRHGMTQILPSAEGMVDVEVRTPTSLFGDVSRLDYVKCDIEGHEGVVVPAMTDLFREHEPIVQVEIAPENRSRIYGLMTELGYSAHFVRGTELVEIQDPDDETIGDWIFVPPSASGVST